MFFPNYLHMGQNISACELNSPEAPGASTAAGPSSAISLRTVWRARPVRLMIYVGLLLVAAIALAGSLAITNLRDNVLADTERELSNIAAVLAEHVERTFGNPYADAACICAGRAGTGRALGRRL